MLVREILRVKGGALYTTTPGQKLPAVIDAMAELDVGSLVVMDEGRMVGIVTFREVIKAMQAGNPELQVSDFMVADPVTAFPDMEANSLRRLMIEKHSRYLPVLEQGQLLGVISFLDVAKAVLEEQTLENTLLKNYIKNWPEEARS
ncbi:CBS domain-containing protein [Azonexus caeni]|jgi:CBS domain-containing protein|uniref:CBS domain-containing protein n=1 Tax=Azonexus caeni TaxID=266126 RepID=UPI003A88834F